MELLFLLLAFTGGTTLSFQQVVNASLGLHIGSMKSSFMNHVVGALSAGLLLLIGLKTGNLFVGKIPFTYFLGGCVGVLMVAMCNFAIPRIGMMVMTIFITSFQLLSSCLIDHFGWLGAKSIPFTFVRGIGIFLLVVGAFFVFTKGRTRAYDTC